MKHQFALGLSVILLASAGIASNASAQEKTRAEVRQELIQAENNGSQFVSDTSYPDVAPIFSQLVADNIKQQDLHSVGAETAGASAAGNRTAPENAGPAVHQAAPSTCVGPASYCTPYYGS